MLAHGIYAVTALLCAVGIVECGVHLWTGSWLQFDELDLALQDFACLYVPAALLGAVDLLVSVIRARRAPA